VNGVDSDNTYRLDTNLGAIRCKYQGQLEPGEAIVIALRPESIHLERQTTESPELNTLPGTVQERYYLGNANDYKINCGGGNVIRVQERPGKVFKEQERLFISFPVDQAWIIRE
jgi:ABC-type Fe3+/spermidine/putrescine transport system ATPase subunit